MRRSWLARVTLREVIIHTDTDQSIRGLIAEVGDDGVLLHHAALLGEKATDLAGDVWIPRATITFVQTVAV